MAEQPWFTSTSHFLRHLLPPARDFYSRELGELGRPSRGWARPKAGCPFHASKSKTSFWIHLESGAFNCFGCHARGGDVLAFVRQRDGLSFSEAARQLGAWDEGGKPIKMLPGPLVRYLVCDFVIDGVEYSAAIKDEPQTELQEHRRFYAEAAARLTELRRGDAERLDREEDVQWGILAASWELIQMEIGR